VDISLFYFQPNNNLLLCLNYAFDKVILGMTIKNQVGRKLIGINLPSLSDIISLGNPDTSWADDCANGNKSTLFSST